jgi:hypothetical protein
MTMKTQLLCLFALFLFACDSDDDSTGTTAGTPAGSVAGTPAGSTGGTPAGSTAGTSAGTPAGSVAGTPAGSVAGTPAGSMMTCDAEPCFDPQFKVSDQGITVALQSSMPQIPERGNNQWVVHVLDETQTPISGCQIVLKPFMTEHMHGGTNVTATEGNVAYLFEAINFFMPGLWEITFDITCGDKMAQPKYSFRVEG